MLNFEVSEERGFEDVNNTSVIKNAPKTHDLGNLKDNNATEATLKSIVIVLRVLSASSIPEPYIASMRQTEALASVIFFVSSVIFFV